MILVYYESYKGGVNNLAVAIDTKTGKRATSTKGRETAANNLRRMVKTPTTKKEAPTWQH